MKQYSYADAVDTVASGGLRGELHGPQEIMLYPEGGGPPTWVGFLLGVGAGFLSGVLVLTKKPPGSGGNIFPFDTQPQEGRQ